jgi:hypothetical protein
MSLASLALLSCAGKHTSPILVNRGVPEYERQYLVEKEGYGIDKRLKKIFLQGYIEEGMTQEMVMMLWGPPDREFTEENIWEWVIINGENAGSLISRVKFKPADQKRLGIQEMVVDVIEGDRYGGSLPPGSAPQ